VAGAIERVLSEAWWQPRRSGLSRLLGPLGSLYGWLARRQADQARRLAWQAPCPTMVVGNLVVGGAGKTPTVIALVQALQQRGWRPGVVSRGHGRASRGVQRAGQPDADARRLGDEPALIHRRTRVPLVVGERRVDAAKVLLAAHPEIDLLIADDGLQHRALGRDLEVWLFDERGTGNGALLPAGPLRQPMPSGLPPQALVLYNADRPTTPLPGDCARRQLSGAVTLADWRQGAAMSPGALTALAGRPLPAYAGIAAPERFFAMLRAAGIEPVPHPLPDHAALDAPPWPAGTADVLCTEKDAAKLAALDDAQLGPTRVWVVGLDFRLPDDFVDAVDRRLRTAAASR